MCVLKLGHSEKRVRKGGVSVHVAIVSLEGTGLKVLQNGVSVWVRNATIGDRRGQVCARG